MKVKGYVVDSSKYIGSSADRDRGTVGSYGFIGKKTSNNSKILGPFRPQGSFISKKEAKHFNLNKDELIKVKIDKKDLCLEKNSYFGQKYVFPKLDKKYEIIEKGYKPNRHNCNRYNDFKKKK